MLINLGLPLQGTRIAVKYVKCLTRGSSEGQWLLSAFRLKVPMLLGRQRAEVVLVKETWRLPCKVHFCTENEELSEHKPTLILVSGFNRNTINGRYLFEPNLYVGTIAINI